MFAICDYFGIGIGEFFDGSNHVPNRIKRALEGLKTMEEDDIDLVLDLIARLRSR